MNYPLVFKIRFINTSLLQRPTMVNAQNNFLKLSKIQNIILMSLSVNEAFSIGFAQDGTDNNSLIPAKVTPLEFVACKFFSLCTMVLQKKSSLFLELK